MARSMLAASRGKASLIGHPEEKEVGHHVVAKQAFRYGAGIDIQVLGGLGILIDSTP